MESAAKAICGVEPFNVTVALNPAPKTRNALAGWPILMPWAAMETLESVHTGEPAVGTV